MIFSSRAREGDGKRELKSFLSKIMLARLLADIEPPRMSGPKWLTDWLTGWLLLLLLLLIAEPIVFSFFFSSQKETNLHLRFLLVLKYM